MARERDDRDDEFEDDERPRRRRPRDDDYEEEIDRRPPRTTSPGTSKAAGIIWIITGSLAAIITLLGVVQLGMSLQGRGPDVFFVCGLLLWLTLTLFGLMAGIRTVAGGSTEPILNGVLSILFALLFLGVGVVMFLAGAEGGRGGPFGRAFGDLLMIMAVVVLVYGLLYLLAGILVLAGRNEYVRYRAYKREQLARRDGYDDRPRRRRDEDDRDRRRRPRDDD